MTTADLLEHTFQRAARYLDSLDSRGVAPTEQALTRLNLLDGLLPDSPTDAEEVIALLDYAGSPGTVASAGGRYFGFVIGGSLPASLAANWLASAWDQNAGLVAASPVAATLESISLKWLLDVLRLPKNSAGAFVTGATMANFTSLAAARHAVLARVGWDVERDGLQDAPPVTVVAGAEAHASLFKALGLLGFGRGRTVVVPTDDEGRMRIDHLPRLDGPAIVCIQAGNVNGGGFDPALSVCDWAHNAGAWVHVDGAFGLWAAAAPARAYLTEGVANADSWATDAHKWLNVPYDSGLAFVRDAEALQAAMSQTGAYYIMGDRREPMHWTPETSRRARGADIWAALRSLGRRGLADLIERNCRYATRFAEGLRAAGYDVLNDVRLNQVVVAFGSEAETLRVIEGVQRDGTCWCGGTRWRDRTAMRISVSSWATTEDDVERSLEAIVRIAAGERRGAHATAAVS
jgi:glutamate/tyrosine decarboxylase-like PLP-dependent enzyme